ncbi:MAG: glycosyltransferase [candidate division WOR-3 bacterium]|nr:glycosyltransferase [candidate division WOR-3 bacterium]
MIRALHVVSSWPTERKPFVKPFIVSQIDSLRESGIVVDVMNLDATGDSFNYLSGMFKIHSRVRRQQYDLIHAHYSYCGWSAIFQRRVPVIVSLMGSDLYGILNGRGSQTPAGLFNILSTKVLLKLVNAVIVKSERMAELVNVGNVFVIPNGVDFGVFKPNSKRRTGQTLSADRRVLFLGNPSLRRKNLLLAQGAMAMVRRRYPAARLVSAFGVGQEKVVELMNSSDLLLLTSLQEGSPNVVKESMACNLPVVSTDVGDVREVIGDTDGCYITSFAPEDVAEKIVRALDFGRETNGRKQIAHLEIGIVARRIIQVYEDILEGKKRR